MNRIGRKLGIPLLALGLGVLAAAIPTRAAFAGKGTVCGPQRRATIEKEIGLLLNGYETATLRSQKPQTKDLLRSIRGLLGQYSETDPCYDFARIRYFRDSLSLRSFGRYGLTDSADVFTASYVYSKLIDLGAIQPIRESDRKAWGGVWTEKGKDGEYKILGAYDCVTGKIRLELDLSPWNLVAVAVHELDHLVRDKLGYVDALDFYGTNATETLLLDETMAAVHAGFVQLSEKRDNNRWSPRSTGNIHGLQIHRLNGAGIAINLYGAENVSGDLSLYREKGGLFRLWKKTVKKVGLGFGDLFRNFLDRMLSVPEEKTDPDLDRILKTIQKGYFPAESAPLASAGRFREWTRRETDRDLPVASLAALQWDLFDDARSDFLRPSKALDLLLSRLKPDAEGKVPPSPGCSALSDAILNGRVGSYLGGRLAGERPEGGSGNRPEGGSGNRPEGGSGNRPEGGSGNRPEGGSGNRPSAPLLPCTRIEAL